MIGKIYLDSNATTAMPDEILEAMLPYMTNQPGFGNASRPHWAGTPAKTAIEQAKQQVADLIGARADELVINSGGSEGVNHAIKGVFFAYLKKPGRKHIITSSIEHPAALGACYFLRDYFGVEVTEIPVDRNCIVDVGAIRDAIRPETILINVMYANHEMGSIQPVEQIAEIARENDILFHIDATCTIGKLDVNVKQLPCDLLTLSGHKFYAPKGVGALYIGQKLRRGIPGRSGTIDFVPLIHGSGSKDSYRAGTANTPLVVGMGKAAEITKSWNTSENRERLRNLTITFWEKLSAELGARIVLNSPPDHHKRTCNTLNVSFVGRSGNELLDKVPRIAASSGPKSEEIARAIGNSDALARGAVRFSFGRKNTIEEVDTAVSDIVAAMNT